MRRKQGVAAILAGALIVLAVLTVFAIELADNQSHSRTTLETQAHQRAVLVSGLIAEVFQRQARIGRDARMALSARRVTPASLSDVPGDTDYAVLVDTSGHVIAHTARFDARQLARADPAASLRLVSAGRSWGIGNVQSGNVINVVARVPGTDRVLITGVPLASLSQFTTSELRTVPGSVAQHQFLVDGRGVVVGSTNPSRRAGYLFRTPAQVKTLRHGSGVIGSANGNRWFDQVTLPGTTWKLIITAPASAFFASVSGFRHYLPWMIFAAFGVVAIVALLLIRRSIRASERIHRTNTRLTDTNAELISARAALERSNQELERQARELARSNADLDQFASIASHDLQEPLRKVRTFTERVSELEGGSLSERGADYLRRANASAERMQRLIEDLLRYSRVSSQDRPFSPVDLGAVAADVLDDLSEQVGGTGARVTIGPLPTINADPAQMRQLIQNLVSNALKFRREDVTPEVRVEASVDSGWLTLTVRDNGIGFDPQYSHRIFRVFERLHGRGAYPGTGIGLALCRKIAERHGGTVAAEGVPGEGATFTVTMQTERTEAVAGTPTSDRGDSGGSANREEPYVTA